MSTILIELTETPREKNRTRNTFSLSLMCNMWYLLWYVLFASTLGIATNTDTWAETEKQTNHQQLALFPHLQPTLWLFCVCFYTTKAHGKARCNTLASKRLIYYSRCTVKWVTLSFFFTINPAKTDESQELEWEYSGCAQLSTRSFSWKKKARQNSDIQELTAQFRNSSRWTDTVVRCNGNTQVSQTRRCFCRVSLTESHFQLSPLAWLFDRDADCHTAPNPMMLDNAAKRADVCWF